MEESNNPLDQVYQLAEELAAHGQLPSPKDLERVARLSLPPIPYVLQYIVDRYNFGNGLLADQHSRLAGFNMSWLAAMIMPSNTPGIIHMWNKVCHYADLAGLPLEVDRAFSKIQGSDAASEAVILESMDTLTALKVVIEGLLVTMSAWRDLPADHPRRLAFDRQHWSGHTVLPVMACEELFSSTLNVLRKLDPSYSHDVEDVWYVAESGFRTLSHLRAWLIGYSKDTLDNIESQIQKKTDELAEVIMAAVDRNNLAVEDARNLIKAEKAGLEVHFSYSRASKAFFDGVLDKAIVEIECGQKLYESYLRLPPSPGGRFRIDGSKQTISTIYAAVGRLLEAKGLLEEVQLDGEDIYDTLRVLWSLGRVRWELGQEDAFKELDSLPDWVHTLEHLSAPYILLLCEATLLDNKMNPKKKRLLLAKQEQILQQYIIQNNYFPGWALTILGEIQVARDSADAPSSLRAAINDPDIRLYPHFLLPRAYFALADFFARHGSPQIALDYVQKAVIALQRSPPKRSGGTTDGYWQRPLSRDWRKVYELQFELELKLGRPKEAFATLQGLVSQSLADSYAGLARFDPRHRLPTQEFQKLTEIREEASQVRRQLHHIWLELETLTKQGPEWISEEKLKKKSNNLESRLCH